MTRRLALLLLLPLVLGATRATSAWQRAAPLPVPRSEVTAALNGNEIVVAGGFLADGSSSTRVDAFSPARNQWRRLPDLPSGLNHAMAAAAGGRVYVLGGYGSDGAPRREGLVLSRGAWRALPSLPAPRAAGGAAIVAGRLYVVGGVGPAGLARSTFVLGLGTLHWRTVPGPTPREHLAVTALGGAIYALGGRTAGFDTNTRRFEVLRPGRGWRVLPRVPEARGGTGAAVVAGRIVSVGGEAPRRTIASVYAYDVRKTRWLRLPDLRTPRHGLGVVAALGRVYAIAGGVRPGLSVSATNEYLAF